MTSFVNDNGEYLDFSGEVGITKQVANFYEFKIKGDVSATIKIPNNSTNRKALGYYGATQIDSPAFSKIAFSMVRDGNIISRGFIVIQDSDEEITCFYTSGNTNWFQSFQFNLREIDFDHKYTVEDFDDDSAALRTATSGTIFPLVDWWARGKKRGSKCYRIGAKNNDESVYFTDAHPCFYLHSLVDEVSKWSGVVIGGDLMDDALFKKIIVTPEEPDYYWPQWIIDQSRCKLESEGGVYNGASDPQLVRLSVVLENGGSAQVDTTNYTWTCPRTAVVQVEFNAEFNVSGKLFECIMYIQRATTGVTDPSVMFSMTVAAERKFISRYLFLNKGDVVYFTMENTLDNTNYRLSLGNDRTWVSFQIKKFIDYDEPIPPMAFVPSMKAIDLIKFLVNYFSCSVYYDEYANKISINKLSAFKKEEAEDWSDYYVSHRERWNTNVAKHNIINFEKTNEDQVMAQNQQGPVSWGGGDIVTSFDATEIKNQYNIPFGGSVDLISATELQLFLPYIKFYELELVDSQPYSGTAADGSYTRFTSTWQDSLTGDDFFYVSSASGIYEGYAPLQSFSTALTNPILYIDYVSNDSGTLYRYRVNKVSSKSRLLICNPGMDITEAGLPTSYQWVDASTYTTAAIAWFDKPILSKPLDSYNEALSIDPINPRSITISERYYGPLKKILSGPYIEAFMRLPVSVFNSFSFDRYIYIKTKDLTGYFIVQKIENYRDALTPVKVELLYVD